MKVKLLFFVGIFSFLFAHSQVNERHFLRGKVMYRGSNVVNESVINTTTDGATITNDNGEFAIWVSEDDELVFMAVNYQLEVVNITSEIIQRNRLVVEVTEKVTELDEVVVGPENQKKFLEIQNEELKGFEYEIDRSSEVENVAFKQNSDQLEDGLNFVNIFKALFLSKEKGDKGLNLRMSDVLRQVYDDQFFVSDLNVPQNKIDEFLFYCDDQMPAQSLLKKQNEFLLIDFLVTQSDGYLKQLNVKE